MAGPSIEPTTPEPEERDFDVRALLHALLDRKWLILGVAVLVFVGGTLWTLRQPKVYEAQATLEYDPNPATPLGSQVEEVSTTGTNYWMAQDFYETQNRIIASRSVAERVVRTLNLHRDPAFMGIPPEGRASFHGGDVRTAAAMVQGRVFVEPVNETRLVHVRVRDGDPRRATALANAIVSAYIDKTLEDRTEATVAAVEWLGTQLDTLRHNLDRAELALHAFKEEHNVLSVSMEDRQNLVATDFESLSKALTETRLHRIELGAHARRLREVLGRGSLEEAASALGEDARVEEIRQQLQEQTAEREALATRYGENHPRIQELDERIAQLRLAVERDLRATVLAAEDQLREAQNVEQQIKSALDEANQAGLALNLREIEYQRLSRERESTSKLYNLVLQRTAEANLTRMLRVTFVRVIDDALEPSGPVSPNVPLNVAASLALGLVLGIAAAFLAHQIDRTVKSPEEVEALGLSLLGVVPEVQGAAEKAKQQRKRRRPGAPAEEGIPNPDVYAHTHPQSAMAECLRAIRTNLVFMSVSHPLRTYVVTSSAPGEGKTTVVSNLAISLAQSGKKVLVVDTDLRRPRLHHAFGLVARVGLSSVLVQESTLDEVLQKTQVPDLYLLPSGPVPPNPAELLHTAAFHEVVEQLKQRFDVVIFDSPPLGPVTDSAVIAGMVDGVILVVKARHATRDGVRSIRRRLTDIGAPILGAVLNSIRPASSKQGYGYGYYAYYHAYQSHPTPTVEEAAAESES